MTTSQKYIFELRCGKCGDAINREMGQFDSIPDCPKCDIPMNVENASKQVAMPQKEKENDGK